MTLKPLVALTLAVATTACLTPTTFAQAGERVAIDFKGGTAAAYVEALQKVVPNLNVVQHGDVGLVPIQEVSIRNADPFTALLLLNGMIVSKSDREIKLEVDQVSFDPGASPIYVITAHTRALAPPQPPRSRIISLADLLSEGVEVDSALSAVETALSLFAGYPEAQIRYHEDTALLIVLAHPQQVITIEEVLDGLRRGVMVQRRKEQESREQDQTQKRLRELESTLQATSSRQSVLVQERTEWQTRAATSQRQLEQMQNDFHAAQTEIMTLRALVERLQQEVDGGR